MFFFQGLGAVYYKPIAYGDNLFYVHKKEGLFTFVDRNLNNKFKVFFEMEGLGFFPNYLKMTTYDRYLYNAAFTSTYKIVKWKGRWGVIDENGSVIINNYYDKIYGFVNRDEGVLKKDNYYYLYRRGELTLIKDNLILDKNYRYLIFQRSTGEGYFLTVHGEIFADNIPFKLLGKEEISYSDFFDSNFARLKSSKYSYLSNKGNLISLEGDFLFNSRVVNNMIILVKQENNTFVLNKRNIVTGEQLTILQKEKIIINPNNKEWQWDWKTLNYPKRNGNKYIYGFSYHNTKTYIGVDYFIDSFNKINKLNEPTFFL